MSVSKYIGVGLFRIVHLISQFCQHRVRCLRFVHSPPPQYSANIPRKSRTTALCPVLLVSSYMRVSLKCKPLCYHLAYLLCKQTQTDGQTKRRGTEAHTCIYTGGLKKKVNCYLQRNKYDLLAQIVLEVFQVGCCSVKNNLSYLILGGGTKIDVAWVAIFITAQAVT